MATPSLYVHRERAQGIREKYTEKVAAIREDRNLSEEGRSRKLAEAWADAKAKLDGLGQQESDLLTGRRGDLERQLFGGSVRSTGMDAGAAAISARDAADRADQLTKPADAAAALRRAESDGDAVLARAIMRHAVRSAEAAPVREAAAAWEGVARTYLDAHPALMPTVEELAEIEDLTKRQVFSPFTLPQPHGVAPRYLNEAQGLTARQSVAAPAPARVGE